MDLVVKEKQNTCTVEMWEDFIQIPTYLVDKPEDSPIFKINFAYQRAKRSIYPYPLNDNLTNEKSVQKYKALFIENKYLKVCVIPELGGRLFYSLDKTDNYDIFYRQAVIKPANVGMNGAWISGGVEWDAIHHHRITSFMPVNAKLVENDDGSKTIWVGEEEYRSRMKWCVGITLYPDKSYMKISGKIINCTSSEQSFLFWANAATRVNENYQIIFPPSNKFGVMHAKSSFCHWPITHESYDGLDHYKNWIDASWWKNNHDLVSIFANNLKDGFLGGYDHGRDAGTMLVFGTPYIPKSGKFFSWGPGNYGHNWDNKLLTDGDDPYIELMQGAYSTSQPDYSWIHPYEIKEFSFYWYGIHEMKGAKAANKQASLNLEFKSDGEILIAANSTGEIDKAIVKLVSLKSGEVLYKNETAISPNNPYKKNIKLDQKNLDPTQLKLILAKNTDEEILTYQPVKEGSHQLLPEPVKPPSKPIKIKTAEELYLTGLRNKQFHNAFVNPMDYFDECLKRDPYNASCNIQVGIYYRERGDYELAAKHLRRAIKRLTKDYTMPRNAESLYQLGLTLKESGELKKATDYLYRSTWDFNYKSSAFFQLAQISTHQNEYKKALEQLNSALIINSLNISALNLKASIFRIADNYAKAKELANKVLQRDPLNTYALNELFRISEINNESRADSLFKSLNGLMRNQPEQYLSLAVDYMNNNLIPEAKRVLERTEGSSDKRLKNYPTIKYYLGYFCHLLDDRYAAKKYFDQAASLPIDYCFPFRLETKKVYETAVSYSAEKANTYYYLGNLLYEKQPGIAMQNWEKATKLNPKFAMAYRNIGWGYNFHLKDYEKAIKNYEKAINIDNSKALWFEELDGIYEKFGVDVFKREEMLVRNHETVEKRFGSIVKEIRMLIHVGKFDKAISYLTNHYFHRIEGVDNLHDIYVDACLLKGLSLMEKDRYNEAIKFFKMADEYPNNQHYARWEIYPKEAQIYYLTGKALDISGNKSDALKYYTMAMQVNTKGDSYGYSKGPKYDYFKALAIRESATEIEITHIFDEMIIAGRNKLANHVDNFFVSYGPGKTIYEVNSDAYYTIGLGFLGKSETEEANEYFRKAIAIKPDHLWSAYFLKRMKL